MYWEVTGNHGLGSQKAFVSLLISIYNVTESNIQTLKLIETYEILFMTTMLSSVIEFQFYSQKIS